MTFLLIMLLLAVSVLGYLYWTANGNLRHRDLKVAELRGRLERHLANEQRFMDALWNRAQLEMARAERTGHRP
jgi:hypothetical protein